MMPHAIWVDEITEVMIFIEKVNKNKNILEKVFFKKFT